MLYGPGTWAKIFPVRGAGPGVGPVWHIPTGSSPRRSTARDAIRRGPAGAALVAVSRSAAGPSKASVPRTRPTGGSGASDAARSAPDDLRKRLGIPEGAVVACYAGRLLPHKGIHVLMEAARRAMSQEASLHLVILGDNPAHAARDVRGELSQQAATWGLGDRIHLPGWLPAVENALVGFDFVVIPSTCREAAPLAHRVYCLGLPAWRARRGTRSCCASRTSARAP